MKKNVIILCSTVLVIAIIGICVLYGKKDKNTGFEKNYGIAHSSTNIGKDGIETVKPEEIVPSQEELTENLTEAGYTVDTFDSVFDTEVACSRIYASKGEAFLDICYNLNPETCEDVFEMFEEQYHTYYILAMNGNFVYCISDNTTFKKAGFTSLANNGIQFINHKNK